MFNIDTITRQNIKELTPYSSARDEFKGEATLWLDANENPFDTGINRYPDPYQKDLKEIVAQQRQLATEQVFIGNGSDEAIDLLFRAFCEPLLDKAFIFPPTYGMYKVSASINNVEVVSLPLTENFDLPDIQTIKKDITSKGLLFICSPNNPTGNYYPLAKIKEIADNFYGLVIVDEAYIDFSDNESAVNLLQSCPNVVVLQTLSKAYGMAGLRLGIAMASPEIITVLNKIKPPYNINILSQQKGIECLLKSRQTKDQIEEIKKERIVLMQALETLPNVTKVYPSEANFILAQFTDANNVITALQNKGIIVRNRTSVAEGCIRFTIGNKSQNSILIESLKEITS